MATVREKRKRTLVILAVVVVLCLAAYLILAGRQKHATEQAKGDFLFSQTPGEITAITYVLEQGEPVELTRTEGTWEDVKYPDAPLIQGNVEDMVTGLLSLRGGNVLKAVEGTPYGLEEPYLKLTLEGKKETSTLLVGDYNATENGYYCTMENANVLYLIPKDAIAVVAKREGELMEAATIPSVPVDSILKFTWKEQGKVVFSLEATEDKDRFLTEWKMTEPYARTVAGYSVGISTALGKFNRAVYSSCYEYHCTDFAQYGLEVPSYEMHWEYQDSQGTKTLDLAFGDQNEDGYYYSRMNEGDEVYLLNPTDAKSFFRLERFSLVYKPLYPGDTTKVNEVLVNETSYPPESQMAKKVLDLVLDGEAEDAPFSITTTALPQGTEPVGEITVIGAGSQETYTFYPYDNRTLYRVVSGEDGSFLITKKSVDAVLELK